MPPSGSDACATPTSCPSHDKYRITLTCTRPGQPEFSSNSNSKSMGNGQHEQDMLCTIKCFAGLFRFPVAEAYMLVRTTN